MGNVIDVSKKGEPEAPVLTRTGKSGLLGGEYLRSDPLAAYLGDTEIAQYVLRNKKSGLRIESAGRDGSAATGNPAASGEPSGDGAIAVEEPAVAESNRDGPEHLEPASDYQALAAVTDVRIVFVVGTPDGDRSASIPLSEIVTVGVDSGILGGELTITTAADDRYVFPCRGDLDAIAEYVDRGAQAWARAYTFLDEARGSLEAAERARRETEFAAAIDAIDDGIEAVASARDRIAAFGAGAADSLAPEADELAETLERRRREIHTEHGVDAHDRARTHWGNREYEAAHEAYHEAIDALERAQELQATAGIEDRVERIEDELAELADAPLSYASAMVEEAEASDDPRTAAQCREVAIERYRDAYALDWGRSDDRFRGDADEIREHVLDALDKLVEYRVTGTERRLEEAEWLRQSDDAEGARETLTAACDALERTQRLVDELTTATYPELTTARAEVEADLEILAEP